MEEEDRIQLVIEIDENVKEILSQGGTDEDILVSLAGLMDEIFKTIISKVSDETMDDYCFTYPGFYKYVKILEGLALFTSQMKTELRTPSTPMAEYEQKVENIQTILTESLHSLMALCREGEMDDEKSLFLVSNFLKAVISTAAGLMEVQITGGSGFLYAEVEKDAKAAGAASIHSFGGKLSETMSLSEIEDHDLPSAMNYLGQQLSTTLFKGILELPASLQGLEVMLRAIEAMFVNLLHQKFKDPHDILDQFTSNAHLSLTDLQSRFQN